MTRARKYLLNFYNHVFPHIDKPVYLSVTGYFQKGVGECYLAGDEWSHFDSCKMSSLTGTLWLFSSAEFMPALKESSWILLLKELLEHWPPGPYLITDIVLYYGLGIERGLE